MNVRWTLKAAFWLLVARATLSFRPEAALARRNRVPQAGKLARETATQLALAVQRAARHLPFHSTCLEQALALEHLLRSAGLQASVVLGVRLVGPTDEASGAGHGGLRERACGGAGGEAPRPTLDAHAWLEHGGQALLGGPPAGLYTPLHRTTRV